MNLSLVARIGWNESAYFFRPPRPPAPVLPDFVEMSGVPPGDEVAATSLSIQEKNIERIYRISNIELKELI